MKKLISFPLMMSFVLLAIIPSCKKSDDAAVAAGAQGSGSLSSGKASIVFNTSAAFAGGTSFSQSNTASTLAQTSTGTFRTIALSATEVSGTSTRTAFLNISVPASANTVSGNLTGDFANPNNATILPVLTLTSTSGASNGIAYASQTGTCTITKLTATEIEGTFSCVVKDTNGTATLSVTSGSFAGKF